MTRMKSAEKWAEEIDEYGQTASQVEAIREEMRRECMKAAEPYAVRDAAALQDALGNAGKPMFRKGQLCFRDKTGDIRVVGLNGCTPGKLWRPIKWSDLCDPKGRWTPDTGILDGPVFLKAATE